MSKSGLSVIDNDPALRALSVSEPPAETRIKNGLFLGTLLLAAVSFYAGAVSAAAAPSLQTPAADLNSGAGPKFEIYTEQAEAGNSLFYIPQSVNQLVSLIHKDNWEVLSYDRPELVSAIRKRPPEFVFCNSDLAAVLQRYLNYTHLLSFKNRVSSGADKLSGTLFVLPKDSLVTHIEELNGLRVGRLRTSSMAGWKTALGAVSSLGLNAGDFFRRVQSFSDNESMIRAMNEGKIDAALLQGCHYERLPEVLRAQIKPLEPRNYSHSSCLSTSELYPAWSVMVAPTVPEPLQQTVANTLKNNTIVPSWGTWVEPVSLRDVYELLCRTDDDLIHEFKPDSPADLLWKARYPALILVLMLFLVFIHDRLVVREVGRQTALVKKGIKARREAEKRIEAWERASVVSTMSSMVAHELKQPLAVIENYTQGLLARQEAGDRQISPETLSFVLSKIDASVKKAIQIIGHVQSLSKNIPPKKKPTDLQKLLQQVLAEFSGNHPEVRIRHHIEPGVVIEADAFELSICLLNILKNAAQAMHGQEDATVSAVLRGEKAGNGSVEIVITDNGPGLTEQQIRNLQNPLQSSKQEGFGLGISIVRSIAERHRGSVRIMRAEPHGLSITLRLGRECKPGKNTTAAQTPSSERTL